MSAEPRTPVQLFGSGQFAEAVARCLRQSSSHRLDRLSGPEEPISADLVISVAGREQRSAIADRAIQAGAKIVSLPVADPTPPSWWGDAAGSGQLRQLSDLTGYAALRRLSQQLHSTGEASPLGRRYSLFATYRLPQRGPTVLAEAVPAFYHYVCSVLGELPVRVQVTMARLFGEQVDGSFALLRCDDGTVVTVEVAACLPASAPTEPEILVEVSGSEAMLRAEPTRQAVQVWSDRGQTRGYGWWVDPAEGFTELALSALSLDGATNTWETNWPRFLAAIRKSVETGQPTEV